jgi:ATP-dependent protease HslVU (ClpYQ) peptidase subunit
MTCIVGLIDKVNQCVIIGADSAGSTEAIIIPRKDTKVFKVGDFVIGCTSSFRMAQLLRFSLNLPRIYDKDIYEYMCTDFINSVRDCFGQGGYLQRDPDGQEQGGGFLVGYKDRLFTVYDDFQVEESLHNYSATGSGYEYAFGALHVYDELQETLKLSANETVLRVLESVSVFDPKVSAPFNVLSTKENND